MNSSPSPQPFFPADDQIASAAQAPGGSLAPETVTVTAPADSGGKSFFDNLLDVVNPLEHLPIVSTIYSNLTGDKPNDFTQVAGDTLYGGPIGLISSVGNLAFKGMTGKSIGDTVWGWVTDKHSDTKTASNDAPRQNQKPSSDLFSFLRANVGDDATAVASNAAPTSTVPVTTAALSPAVATPSPATPAAAQTASTAGATAPPRFFNRLPARGAIPTHTEPSENVRAADMAAMVANRAHLRTPASEGNAPAMLAATPGQNPVPAQIVPQQTPVASNRSPTVSVGSDGIPTLNSNGEQALLDALKKNGISGAIGQQALMAYQKTMAMNPDPSAAAALQSATLH
jgi:hypothetical protein